MRITGYRAYCIFLMLTKMHFSKSKFNISKTRGYSDKYIKSWNQHVRNKELEAILFFKLDKKFECDQDLIDVYTSYWLKNPSFWVKDIFDDDFQTYKNWLGEWNNIESSLHNSWYDLLSFVSEKDIPKEQIFFKESGLPIVYRFYFQHKLSVTILVILDLIYKFSKKLNVDHLAICDQERVKTLQFVFDKYPKAVYNRFSKLNLSMFRQSIRRNTHGFFGI